MAEYYSEVEQMLIEEREEGREEGEARGIMRMALKFGKDKDFIISSLATELSITTEKAKEYYETYSN